MNLLLGLGKFAHTKKKKEKSVNKRWTSAAAAASDSGPTYILQSFFLFLKLIISLGELLLNQVQFILDLLHLLLQDANLLLSLGEK